MPLELLHEKMRQRAFILFLNCVPLRHPNVWGIQ